MEKHKDADLEIHLLGHSMGSLVAMHLALDHPQLPLRSVTLSSPLFGVSVEVPLVKRAAAGILSDLWGKLQMKTGLNAENLSHDPAVIEAYRKDRLVHELCTPRLYTEMMSAMKNAAKRPGEIAFPTLMQVPMADKIVDPEAAITYHRASQKTELKTYAGFFHESYNETGKQQPFEDLKTWITHNTTQHSVLS
jgi:lysophospholipase